MEKNKIISEGKRVRKNTSSSANLAIDEETLENIKLYSDLSEEEINHRIKELDNEWDIERVLELNMSTLALTGIILAIIDSKRWLALSATVLGFFAQHALQGWCPPIPVFRRFGVRTRNEINEEKHALKAIRGDYKDIKTAEEAFIAAIKQEH